jgi:hypothetical protein
MNTAKASLELKSALLMTGLVQPVSSETEVRKISVLCRQVPGQESAWLKVVHKLLEKAEETSIDLLVCRRYLLKDGRMVFGWYLEIHGKKAAAISAATSVLIEVLEGAKPSLVSTPEVPQARPVVSTPVVQESPKTPPKKEESRGSMSVNVIHRKVNPQTGQITEITEMPLPHVYRDLNVPTEPTFSPKLGKYVGGGRGAKGV